MRARVAAEHERAGRCCPAATRVTARRTRTAPPAWSAGPCCGPAQPRSRCAGRHRHAARPRGRKSRRGRSRSRTLLRKDVHRCPVLGLSVLQKLLLGRLSALGMSYLPCHVKKRPIQFSLDSTFSQPQQPQYFFSAAPSRSSDSSSSSRRRRGEGDMASSSGAAHGRLAALGKGGRNHHHLPRHRPRQAALALIIRTANTWRVAALAATVASR
jgi:hypothetical protein